jgi:hypothetical protein
MIEAYFGHVRAVPHPEALCQGKHFSWRGKNYWRPAEVGPCCVPSSRLPVFSQVAPVDLDCGSLDVGHSPAPVTAIKPLISLSGLLLALKHESRAGLTPQFPQSLRLKWSDPVLPVCGITS